MKRILSLSILSLLFALNAFAGPIKTVEVTPLAHTPLLVAKDFTSAAVSGAGDKAVLSLTLTDAAAKRMKDFTAKNVGRKLPLLIDGTPVQAPVIRVPIEGGAFEVEPMNRALAEEVAQFINAHK